MAPSDLDRVEIYKSRARGRRGWRWRYVAAGNNKRLANGGESYGSQEELIETLVRVLHIRPEAWIPVADAPQGKDYVAMRRNGEPLVVRVKNR